MKDTNELLQQLDDFKLCDGIFCRFADFNNTIVVDAMQKSERIVTLVWHASGLIDNGGFHYLLEGDFDGDPGFVYTAASFKAIGAENAYQAFQNLLQCFPNGRLHEDTMERIEFYESILQTQKDSIDNHFYKDSERISNLLASYIRGNSRDIADILTTKEVAQQNEVGDDSHCTYS